MSHLPRNNRYELFIFDGKCSCIDDPSLDSFEYNDDMIEWLNDHCEKIPTLLYRYKDFNVYYLQPEFYTWWKIRWSQ